MGDGHYLSVPQMQRSVTSPYGGRIHRLFIFIRLSAPNPSMNMYHQIPNRMPEMNANGPSQQMSMGYGMPRPDGSGAIQYDNTNFPVLAGQPQQLRYPTPTGASMNHPGNSIQHEEFTLHNEEDFPALPGSHAFTTQKASGFGFRDSVDDSSQELPPNSYPNTIPLGSGRSQVAPQYSTHPSSPGLPSTNPSSLPGSSPSVTPSRPVPSTKVASPKLQPSTEGIANRPEAKYGLLGLLDVIRLTDRVDRLFSFLLTFFDRISIFWRLVRI